MQRDLDLQRLAGKGIGVEFDEDTTAPFARGERIFRGFEVGVASDVAEFAETKLL